MRRVCCFRPCSRSHSGARIASTSRTQLSRAAVGGTSLLIAESKQLGYANFDQFAKKFFIESFLSKSTVNVPNANFDFFSDKIAE